MSDSRLDVCCGAFARARNLLDVGPEPLVPMMKQLQWRHGRVDASVVMDTAALFARRPFPPLRLVRDDDEPRA